MRTDYRDDITNALKVLREDGVILYPTDTVWGLGCDATSGAAVEKIFSIKQRSGGKSLLVLVNGLTMLERYVRSIPDVASNLLEVTDKPLTIIYPAGRNLAPGICGEDGSVGIRICEDGFCSELIGRLRKPLVSTSANMSEMPAPSFFGEIDERIIKSADYVVGYRQDDTIKKTPSPVIKVSDDGVIKIIRQ